MEDDPLDAVPFGGCPEPLDAAVRHDRLSGELARLRRRIDRLRAFPLRAELDALTAACHATMAGLPRQEPAEPVFDGMSAAQIVDYLTLSRSVLFDAQHYRALYPDVLGDPLHHYLFYGGQEGRRPSAWFDGAAYAAANPDVASAGLNPLVHYERQGRLEGRSPAPRHHAAAPAAAALRIVADVRSFAEFQSFKARFPAAIDPATGRRIAGAALAYGTRTAFLGTIGADDTAQTGTDLREHLISGGLNARHRAVADTILWALEQNGVAEADARIYGHEGITHLARLMAARFEGFVGSEYAPTEEEQCAVFPVVHNDVCASRFDDDRFDIIFSCDVLEHVYDRDACLRETCRNLVPGGYFIATFPFDCDHPDSWLFARYDAGAVTHLLETPIYHGNPMDADGGSLVFEIPGWNIVERALAAGFADAAMRIICDETKGIAGSPQSSGTAVQGVFVFLCRK